MITSKTNENVKFIKNLNEKKFRNKFNMFYLEGVKVTNETLDIYLEGAVEIISIAYSFDILSKVKGGNELLDRINSLNENSNRNELSSINIYEISPSVFEYITDTVTTQGVLVVVKAKENTFDCLDLNSNIVILDRIQDLGNLGSIIRSADSFYFKNVICVKGTADIYSPKVIRSTMVSILRTNIIYVDDLNELNRNLKDNNYTIIATSLNTDIYLNKLENIVKGNKINNKIAIILGNEASGISNEISDIADVLVKIPMNDKVDSLNVASAASIMMYEFS